MYRLFLAVRYLVARPISWISMLGIWITVTSTIVTLAIFAGYLREIRATFRGTTADVVVTPHPFPRSGPAKLPSYAEIREAIRDVPGIRATSPHLLRPVLLRPGPRRDDPDGLEEIGEKNFGQLVGLDPELDRATTDFARHVRAEPDARLQVDDAQRPFQVDRAALRPEDRDLPVLLVGTVACRTLGIVKGQRVSLATLPDDVRDDEFEPLTMDFVVGGAVRTGYFDLDQSGVYAELAVAKEFAKAAGDATEICVKAEDGAPLDELVLAIKRRLESRRLPASAETWHARQANFLAAIASQKNVLALLMFFFVLVASFNVFATMSILVGDKTRDVGVLGAMGANPGGIMHLFVTGGLLMALVSSLVGSVTGMLVAENINAIHEGITWLTGVQIFKPEVYKLDGIPVEVQAWTLPLVVAATVLFAVLSAALPALRAARLDPVRALRQE